MGIACFRSENPEPMDIKKEGRHFCINCGKLIRDKQLFMMYTHPVPLRRMNKTVYNHYKC
jgi:hypothetical protein